MKKLTYGILIVVVLFMIAGCKIHKKENTENNSNKEETIHKTNNTNEVIKSVKAIINNKEYIINLEDSDTVKSFVNYLPQELKMNELNGNEKYVNLDTSFPTNETNPKRINKGDVMLFGDNCLVIFYKSFDTPYNYTKIGHIDNLEDLGKENITVKFEK